MKRPVIANNFLTHTLDVGYESPEVTKVCFCGDVAQLGERGVRNAEARGSSPLISTIT